MEDLKWEDPYSHGQPSGLPPIPRFLFCRESGLLGRRVFFSKDFPWNDAAQDIGEERLVTKELEATFCQLNGQHTRSTFLMVFSPDKELVASTHGDHNIYISVVKTGKCCQTLRGHPRTPWCVAFHPSFSGVLASGCLGGVVRVWDIIGGGSEVWRASSVIASLAFHPTDKLLVVATCNQLHFWDWSVRGTPIIKIATKSEKEKVRYVKFDSKGHYLITGIANLYNAAASTADRATVSTSNRHESSAMILDPLHIRPDDREPVSMSRYGRYRRMSWLSSLASNTGATIVNRTTDRGTDASIQSGRSMAAPAEQDVAAPPTSSTASQTLSDLAAAASSQLMVENAAASSSADAVGSSAASDSIDEPLPFTHSPQSSFRAVVNDVPWSSANSGIDMNAIFSEPLGNRETLNDNYGLMPWPQGPAGNQNFRANRNRIEELIQERDSLVNQLDDFRSMQQRASGEADPWRHVDPWAVDSRFSSETVVARGRSGGSRRLAHDMPAPSSTSTFTHRSSSTARLLPNNDHTYTQRLQDNAFASGNENATDEDSHALHNANGDDEGDDIGRNGDSSSILSNMDIELLSRHIFHMQRICRASLQDCTRQRRQVIRLQSIRKNLEDLQRQIRSLRSVAVERLSRLEDVIDRRGLQDSDRRISDNSSLAVGLRTRSRRNILDLESNFDERQGEGEHLAPLRHSMNARLSSALVRLRRSKRSHYLRAHYRLLSQMRATFRAFEMSPDLSSRAPSRSRSPTQLPAAPEQPQSQADSYEYSSCSQQPAAVNSESETVLPLVSSERCQNDKSVDSAGVSTRSELRAISQRLERILRTQREALGSPDVTNDCSLEDDESSWIRPPASNSTLDFHDSESESDNDASLSEPSFGFSSRLPTRYTGSSLTACPGSPRSTINNYLSAIRMSGQIYRSWERQRQARHFFFQRRRQRLFGSYAGRSHSSHSGIFTPSVGSYHGLLEADDDDDEEDGDGDRDSQSANAFDRGTSSTGLPAVDEEDEVNQDRLPPLREIIWRRLRRRNAQLNMLDDDLTSSSNANQHHLAEAQQRRQGLLDQQQPQQRPEVRQSQQPRLGQHRSTRDREFLSFMVDQMRLDQNETIASRGSTSVPSSSASSSSGISAAPPSHVPAPTVPPPAMPTEIVSRFQSWSGLMADVPVPPAPSNAHVPAQPVIANPREQQFILHNTPACMLLTHRIQCWHVHKGHLPSIEDANRNVIVKEAKIHNDASVDISEDGSILVTLVPSNMPMITVVGVYGLQPDFHRGRCYATYSLYSSAVSVSLSPTSRYLLVGLAFRTVGRISISPAAADRSLMAQIFRIHTHWDRGKLVPRRDLHLISMADSSILNQTSLNCIRWIPSAGNGIVYATNTGLLNILK